MNILILLNFAASLQGVFLTYLIVHSRFKSKSNVVLGVLTLVLSLSLLGGVLGLSGYYKVYPHLINVADPLFLLYGPLLYLYIFLLTNNRLPKYYLVHGGVYVAYVISFVPFYLSSPQEKIDFAEYIFLNDEEPLKALFMQLLRILHITAYIILSLVIVRRYQKRIKANFSEIGKITLNQVKNILYFFLFVLATAFTTFLLGYLTTFNYNLSNNITGLSVSLIIYTIAISTWKKKDSYDGELAQILEQKPESGKISVNGHSQQKGRSVFVLSDSQFNDFSERLKESMETDKAFTENEISLTELSNKIGIQPYQLSELISRISGESFFEYINRRRVEEIKERLKDPKYDALSLLGIAMDCGFNSKSSFNTAFKKYTGLTPSEYRKQVLQ